MRAASSWRELNPPLSLCRYSRSQIQINKYIENRQSTILQLIFGLLCGQEQIICHALNVFGPISDPTLHISGKALIVALAETMKKISYALRDA